MKCVAPVLIDSCVWLRAKNGNVYDTQFICRLARKGIAIRISQNVLAELSRLFMMSEHNVIEWISNFELKFQVIRYSEQEISESKRLSKNYLYCHFPDNRLLAYCRLNGAILVTYDAKLLRCAQLESVMCCMPSGLPTYLLGAAAS